MATRPLKTLRKMEVTYRRTLLAEPTEDYASIHDANDAKTLARRLIGDETQEVMVLLFLNTAHKITGYSEISRGGLSETTVDPKILFRNALLSNASAFIIVHNHPSGNLTPSLSDIEMTKRVNDGANALGLTFLDHLIVTSEGHFSLACERLGGF